MVCGLFVLCRFLSVFVSAREKEDEFNLLEHVFTERIHVKTARGSLEYT